MTWNRSVIVFDKRSFIKTAKYELYLLKNNFKELYVGTYKILEVAIGLSAKRHLQALIARRFFNEWIN